MACRSNKFFLLPQSLGGGGQGLAHKPIGNQGQQGTAGEPKPDVLQSGPQHMPGKKALLLHHHQQQIFPLRTAREQGCGAMVKIAAASAQIEMGFLLYNGTVLIEIGAIQKKLGPFQGQRFQLTAR